MKTLSKTKESPIRITERDKRRLETMADRIRQEGGNEEGLTALMTALKRAATTKSEFIPRNFVTMGSRVSIIDTVTSEMLKVQLVYPEDADPRSNKYSVLSPMGAGVLGAGLGDEFEWESPEGTRRFVISKVDFQPEATNHYRL